MKIAIFSDIHSNLEALEVFVSNARGKVDLFVCLGDVIGYGPDPSVCLSVVKNLCGNDWAVRGNHEKAVLDPKELRHFNPIAGESILWTTENISESDKEYIRSLSDVIEFNNYIFVHGSPRDPDEYVTTLHSAIANIQIMKKSHKKICFHGHTHVPVIWSEEKFFIPEPFSPIQLDKNLFYMINPGSIGQPRDGMPDISFIVFDEEKYTVEFLRFPYDIRTTYGKIIQRGIPEYLGRRLFFGR